MSIVNREDELFLCGLKTLIEWKAAVFYEICEIVTVSVIFEDLAHIIKSRDDIKAVAFPSV